MPVHSAGPRLYASVKFKHLVHGAGSAAGSRPANISLNLTSFVDMMTILVTFLLMVFSSTGQLLQAQKGLELPIATARETL
jgi:biopolymer transport protein ExbD